MIPADEEYARMLAHDAKRQQEIMRSLAYSLPPISIDMYLRMGEIPRDMEELVDTFICQYLRPVADLATMLGTELLYESYIYPKKETSEEDEEDDDEDNENFPEEDEEEVALPMVYLGYQVDSRIQIDDLHKAGYLVYDIQTNDYGMRVAFPSGYGYSFMTAHHFPLFLYTHGRYEWPVLLPDVGYRRLTLGANK